MYRQLHCRRGPLDGAVAVFLLAALLSAGVGLLNGNSLSLVLRDVRFPLYYAAIFLVTSFVDRNTALRVFVPVLVLAGLAVSFEYILEFVGAIDLSMGSRFKRVARLQGLSLPIGLLFLVNQYLHDPRRYGRWMLAALAVPMGLAFVLTVGRGMWVAFAIGLVASILLRYVGSEGQGPAGGTGGDAGVRCPVSVGNDGFPLPTRYWSRHRGPRPGALPHFRGLRTRCTRSRQAAILSLGDRGRSPNIR